MNYYQFVNPTFVHARIEEWGGLEISEEVYQMFENSLFSARENLKQSVIGLDFNEIRTSVHAFKANCSYYVDPDSDYFKFLLDFERKGMLHDQENLEDYLNRFLTDSEKMLIELKLIMEEIKSNQTF
jgi:hypothetical protein